MLGFSDLAAKTFCRAQSFCLFRLCGGEGEEKRLQKDTRRVANVSQLTATLAPFQTAQWRIACHSRVGGRGVQTHKASLGCLTRGIAQNWLQGLMLLLRHESVSLLKIFAREI